MRACKSYSKQKPIKNFESVEYFGGAQSKRKTAQIEKNIALRLDDGCATDGQRWKGRQGFQPP